MGMEAQEGNAPERTQSGRQNSGAGRRQNNYRGRRNDHAKASAFGQSANAAQVPSLSGFCLDAWFWMTCIQS